MSEPHTPETMEHVEHAHHLLGESDNPMLRFVPLTAAVLAIFAGLCGLYSSHLSITALALRSESVLSQAQASDVWTQYEAESLKAHVYEAAELAGGTPAKAKLDALIKKYRAEQPPLQKDALAKEAQRDEHFAASEAAEHRHLIFDVAVAFFEISIVLASIAAMTKQSWLFIAGAIGGVGGIAAAIFGLVG